MKIHPHIKRALCAIALSLLSLSSISAQTAASLIEQANKLFTESYGDRDSQKCKESLQLLQQACDLDKSSSEARFEFGKAYISAKHIDLSLANIKKGYKLIHEAADMGNIYAAIYLFEYPESRDKVPSVSGWGDKNYRKFDKQKTEYANKLLAMPIPANFNDYLSLAKAAAQDRNYSLLSKYAAIAMNNGEIGADDYFAQSGYYKYIDFDSISPKVQFDIAAKLWNRDFENKETGENGLLLIKKSAEAGYAEAQYQMYVNHWRGYYVEEDTIQAIKWLRLAAENGSPRSLMTMGQFYAKGLHGVPQDSVKAFESFKSSTKLGNQDSAWRLALCYLYGFGTEPNQAKARELFEKFRGIYTNLDYFVALTYYNELSPKAVELFEQCAKDSKLPDSQRSDALRKLSACYRFGRCGVATDPDKADSLLKEAATDGDQEATDVLLFLNLN